MLPLCAIRKRTLIVSRSPSGSSLWACARILDVCLSAMRCVTTHTLTHALVRHSVGMQQRLSDVHLCGTPSVLVTQRCALLAVALLRSSRSPANARSLDADSLAVYWHRAIMPVAGFARAMAHTTTHRVIAESLRLRLRLRRWSRLRTGQCHSRESSLLFCCSTHPEGTRSSQSGNPALRVPRRFEACSRLNSHCSRRLITSWEEFLLRLLYSLVPTATQLHPTPYSGDRNTDSSVRICCLRKHVISFYSTTVLCTSRGTP